jgi:glycerophosphoryl diester phosphodiesterase
MAAFSLIREHGITGVELDVRRCATGEIVVIHDATLARTGGIELPVADSPLSELCEHDIGSWFGAEFSGERLPLLSDVLELLGSDHYIDIEIKHHAGTRGQAFPHSIEWDVVQLVRERGLVSHVLISSFDPRIVRRVHNLAPEIRCAAIYARAPEMPWYLRSGLGTRFAGATAMKPQWKQVTERTIAASRRRDIPVVTWTVDEEADAVQLAKLGVAGIVSNRPGEIAAAIGAESS